MIRKTIFYSVLLIALLVLAFRIYDLSVSLAYSQMQLKEDQNAIQVVAKYQREECEYAYKRVDGVSVFMKEADVVIQGVRFTCQKGKDLKPRLFMAVR